MIILALAYLFRGEVKVLTGGMAQGVEASKAKARELRKQLIWCDSRADGIVRMEETLLMRQTDV